ncbi:MAG TPA: RtcB family protein [Flavitalea sp.]|nr:RtcB family protein [Flavitalea sp.]
MSKKIKGDDLKKVGYNEGKILGMALDAAQKLKKVRKDQVLVLLKKVKDYPESFLEDPEMKGLAQAMIEHLNKPVETTISLKPTTQTYKIYGAEYIEDGARSQMDVAMKLPVTIGGALMPDAHQGYGLPIGGVLATDNVVIPYGVGVDIGCRMALTIFDIPEKDFEKNESKYKRELIAHTKFGAGEAFKGSDRSDHEVLTRKEFNIAPFINQMRDKAWSQLGTSGGGNHFAEWGIIQFSDEDFKLGIGKGNYVALLTHSGSRGFGATIAGHYTKLAKEICKLPKEAINLAYLDLNSQEGHEYWVAMNLAGDYASACHEVIHDKLVKAIGGTVLGRIENHHNFAWMEKWQGREVIVHRKGATPAGTGVMGIIPGSMATPGFLVRGRGDENSINSASHGAGRLMSRTQAIKSISKSDLAAVLHDNKITLIGAGLDEAPMAYKDINMVMNAQQDLVDVVARFRPAIVRMARDGSRED